MLNYRSQLAEQTGQDESDMPLARDIDAHDLADIIRGHIENADEELWAGSEMYARIVSVAVK